MTKIIAASIDMNKCTEQIGNRFDLVLVASLRAKELRRNYTPKLDLKNSATTIALAEIEAGLIGKEYLHRIK
jgi:DNA-directed RNA polymerase subunit omega